MRKIQRLGALVAAAGLMLAGCAHTTPGKTFDALAAAGLTRNAYCALTPEARAEVRRKLDIQTPIIACAASS